MQAGRVQRRHLQLVCDCPRARAGPEQLKAEEVTRHFYEESRGQVDGMNTEAGR